MSTAILVHGGAGDIGADDRARACAEGCREAARVGHAVLAAGGSALDAVQAACVALEDNPLYNAGTGAALNRDGEVELDAAIMSGTDLRVGAVAAIRGVRNPILVARLVMEKTSHVLLAGAGAELFAREQGIEPYPPALLVKERALAEWRLQRDRASKPRPGTVGAVAIDARGHVAAATSTGGVSGKLPGRVGDTPLPGSGTYADERGGAASGTGYGEFFIRVVLAKHATDRMAAGMPAQEAALDSIAQLGRVGGEGGVILVDREGRLGLAANTRRMSWAMIRLDGSEDAGFIAPAPT